jgi:hypothetical protein
MWIADLGLTFWLAYLSRTALLVILALFYKQGDFQYAKMIDLVDRIFTVVIGLGWLIFSIFAEEYYRTGALKESFLKRFARVTGPILLCIFIVDLIIFWIQGISATDWLRWLILTAELGIGLALFVYSKQKLASNSN